MALNLPDSGTGKTDRLTLGVGRLYIGGAGVTPSTDVGYARTASLQVTRSRLEVQQGVPRQTVYQFVNQEEVTLNFTGLEWHIERLRDVFAVTNAATGTDGTGGGSLGFGGDTNLREVSLRFVHQMPSGGTVNVYIWRAQGTGEATFTFGDEIHELPYGFRAIVATTEWDNTSLADSEQFMRVQIQAPGAGFGT